MGLDLYFHLVKKTRSRKTNESLSEYYNVLAEDEDARFTEDFKSKAYEGIELLRKTKDEWMEKNPEGGFAMRCIWWTVSAFRSEMDKFFSYDFLTEPIEKAETIEEIEEWVQKQEQGMYRPSTAYFRKVNCIYAYFSERLEDEKCIVDKSDIVDIMQRAIRILESKDEELAKEILPTQGGFFFGSTDYDEYYYEDMIEILKEFGKLLKEWKDDELCFVLMSW